MINELHKMSKVFTQSNIWCIWTFMFFCCCTITLSLRSFIYIITFYTFCFMQKKVESSVEEVISVYKQMHSLPEWVLAVSGYKRETIKTSGCTSGNVFFSSHYCLNASYHSHFSSNVQLIYVRGLWLLLFQLLLLF